MLERFKSNSGHVGVVGLGYVGLPLSIAFVEAGYRVTGLDIDAEKVALLNRDETYIRHIGADAIAKMNASGRFSATTDFAQSGDVDAIVICVPTPLKNGREPDLGPVLSTGKEIAKYLQKGQLVVLESSTYPGTTDTDLANVLEVSGLKANEDFYLAYSPEREDPGNADFGTSRIPKLVGADTPEALALSVALYEDVISEVIPVSSARAAEAAKLTENTFRAVNIAMVNELKVIFDKMDIDTNEVLAAAATKWNFLPFKPGLVGGHCIGVDPYYLAHKASSLGYHPQVILSGRHVNDQMSSFVSEKIIKLLVKNNFKVQGAKVLLLGVTFKENCPDIRNSQAFEIYTALKNKGVAVFAFDPFANAQEVFDAHQINLVTSLETYDAIVLTVAHDFFKSLNYASLKSSPTSVIYDTKAILDKSIVTARL